MRSVSKIFVQLDILGELVMTTLRMPEWQVERGHLCTRDSSCVLATTFRIGSWSVAPSVQGLTVVYRKIHAAYRTQ